MATIPKDISKVQPQKAADPRRSQRVMVRVPVQVTGQGADGTPLLEDTTTLIVNAHGALILLAAKVSVGQALTLTNLATLEKLTCNVANLGAQNSGKIEVGVGFTAAAPFFWRITFPPADWNPRSAIDET